MKNKIYFGILLLSLLQFSCKKDDCFTPPDDLAFTFVNSENTDVFHSGIYELDSLKVFYLNGVVKTPIAYNTVSSAYDSKIYYVFQSAELYEKAWNVNSNSVFLFQLNSMKTDTLNVHFMQQTTGDCTLVEFDDLKYNNSSLSFFNAGEAPLKYAYKIIL